MYLRKHLHTYENTYIHTKTLTYLRKHWHTYENTYILTKTLTYLRKHLHTYEVSRELRVGTQKPARSPGNRGLTCSCCSPGAKVAREQRLQGLETRSGREHRPGRRSQRQTKGGRRRPDQVQVWGGKPGQHDQPRALPGHQVPILQILVYEYLFYKYL
jgi:hypothetical protein